jgi:hypothetical protein
MLISAFYLPAIQTSQEIINIEPVNALESVCDGTSKRLLVRLDRPEAISQAEQ